jgi:adenylate cyclase
MSARRSFGFSRGALLALAVALPIGAITWVAFETDVAAEARADLADRMLPDTDVDERLYIVALDREFLDEAAANPLVWSTLVQQIAAERPRTAVLPIGAIDAANPGIGEDEFEELVKAVFVEIDGLVLESSRVVLGAADPRSGAPALAAERLRTALAPVADAVGFESTALDLRDDVFRTAPLVAERLLVGRNAPVLTPSAALVAVLRAEEIEPVVVTRGDELRVGDRRIPIEDGGRVRVAWSDALQAGGARVLTASGVLASGGDDRLHDATLVVGLTDPSVASLVPTPLGEGGRMAAPFVTAQVVNTLLTESYVEPAPAWSLVGSALAASFIVVLLLLVLPVWLAPAVLVGGGTGVWLLHQWLASRGVLPDPAVGLAALVAAFIAGIALRVGHELLRRRHVTRLFTQYVPEKVARQLVDPRTFAAVTAGQRVEVSVLFCDLRGFTPLSARLEPHQVREMLDLFYERITEVVLSLDGTVMKFVGDEVFAVFGAPLPQVDHASRAIDCARTILSIRDPLCDELRNRGLPEIAYGIGVNSGEAIAAHTGSDIRRQYDVLGGPVNIGSRLCGQAKVGEAVASETTVLAAGAPTDSLERIGPLDLKGVDEPVVCYRVTASASASAGG